MQPLTSKLTTIASISIILMFVLFFLQYSLKCCKPLRDKPTNRTVTCCHTLDSPDKRSFYNYGKHVTLWREDNRHLMTAVTSSPWEVGYKCGPLQLCKGTLHLNRQQLHIANTWPQLRVKQYKAWGFMRNNHQWYEKKVFFPTIPDHQEGHYMLEK